MTADERERTQYDWTHGKVQIIAATIAFGMGEDVFCLIVHSVMHSRSNVRDVASVYEQLCRLYACWKIL